jgi:hypothetical protein
MPSQGDVHVVPKGDNWAIEVEGNARASSVHETQTSAIDAGRELAKNNAAELLIYGKDGQGPAEEEVPMVIFPAQDVESA